jgi:hypothetical protein
MAAKIERPFVKNAGLTPAVLKARPESMPPKAARLGPRAGGGHRFPAERRGGAARLIRADRSRNGPSARSAEAGRKLDSPIPDLMSGAKPSPVSTLRG